MAFYQPCLLPFPPFPLAKEEYAYKYANKLYDNNGQVVDNGDVTGIWRNQSGSGISTITAA